MDFLLRREARVEWLGSLYDHKGLLNSFSDAKNGCWDVFFEPSPGSSPPLGVVWMKARDNSARYSLLCGYIAASVALRRQRRIPLDRVIVECKGRGYILQSQSRMHRCTLNARSMVTMYWTNPGRRSAHLTFLMRRGCAFTYDG